VNALVAHLRQAGDHGHLPFHPHCPTCRAGRLAGALPEDPVVPRRLRVSLAATVIGVSAVLGATRGTTAARAQTDGTGPTATTARGETTSTPTVSPKQLEKHLADPNKAAPKTEPAGSGTYLVRPGDCLWTIAAGQLGGHATNARIARHVDLLWHLNAKRIGTGNPNLILPGQRLHLT
jgi:Tfp pilus assembly protein FimV